MIQFYGASWCADCRRAKFFFDSNKIEYSYYDIDTDTEALNKVREYNKNGNESIPLIIFEDGSFLIEPGYKDLEKKLLS